MLKAGIEEDLRRAKEALEAAERNFKEDDIYTAANRTFVACENAVYVLLKQKFGSTSISRSRILTRLKEINPGAKDAYDKSYDLRVQADYGREAKTLPLNRDNLSNVLEEVKKTVDEADKLFK